MPNSDEKKFEFENLMRPDSGLMSPINRLIRVKTRRESHNVNGTLLVLNFFCYYPELKYCTDDDDDDDDDDDNNDDANDENWTEPLRPTYQSLDAYFVEILTEDEQLDAYFNGVPMVSECKASATDEERDKISAIYSSLASLPKLNPSSKRKNAAREHLTDRQMYVFMRFLIFVGILLSRQFSPHGVCNCVIVAV